MIDEKNILLAEEEMRRCRKFARISARSQQAIEYGQHTTKARSEREIARDNLIGKIAEVAFSKMLKENYGIDVPLDFNYYPRGQWDNQDAEINGWRIDIKATREGGRWMLIEWNKLNFRQRDNDLSHLFVLFTVGWNRQTDQPTGTAAYQGAVSLEKLKKSCTTTHELRKGSNIPGTSARLQADNYGIRFSDLYKDTDELIRILMEAPPAKTLTDNYRNPYTGETTLEVLGKVSSQAGSESGLPTEAEERTIFKRLSAKLKSMLHSFFRDRGA